MMCNEICPLCNRVMIEGKSIDYHHLIPKAKKGKEAEKIHRICHVKIHSCLSENELQKYYYTWSRLLSHEEIQKFVKWVSKKHPEYYDSSRDTKKRNKKRNNRF